MPPRNVYIHPTSCVETQDIGEGTRIWAFAHVLENARIGANCNIGDHCFIESHVMIGSNVTVKNGNMIWEGVTLENGVFVGPNVLFTNDLYPRSPRLAQAKPRYSSREWLLPTLVQQGASIGAGAVILAGITIHDFAMVGAGAVVTRDVSPYTLVAGNPAQATGWVCQCGQRLRFRAETAICGACGLEFVKHSDMVRIVTAQETTE